MTTTHPDARGDARHIEQETRQAQRVVAETAFHVRDVTLIILTVLAIFYTLYFAADIVLPLVLALVLSLLLGPAANFLNHRLHVPRMLAALLLILTLFSAIGAIGYAISVPARDWIAKAPQSLPTLEKKLSFLSKPIGALQNGLHEMQSLMRRAEPGADPGSTRQGRADQAPPTALSADAAAQPPAGQAPTGAKPPAPAQTVTVQQASSVTGVGMTVLNGTRAFLGQVLTLVIVLFFLIADGDSLLRRFVEILPGFSEKKRAVQIATEVAHNISGYLATITMMNLLVGAANGLSVWAFGLPSPLLWGVVAFLLNYVPILGPLTGVLIFFFVGLFSFSSVVWALAPAGVYLLIHIMEGETITPMLLARRFTLNPLLVIVALMFWDWLWGIPGALLAVPMLAVTKIMCDNIEVLTPLGHLLGAEPSRHAK